MITKIISTIGTRVYMGVILLLILGLHSKYLGAEILGGLAIFRFGLTINHLFGSVFSGPAVVYLGNRLSVNRLVMPTVVWVLGSTALLSVMQTYLELIDPAYFWHLVALSILWSAQSFLEQVLLSRQLVHLYNISAFIYHTVLFGACLMLIFYNGWHTEAVFFVSMYAALISSGIFLLVANWGFFDVSRFSFNLKIARIIFNYGFWVQVNNVVQTLNYRFSLLLLDAYCGKRVVGYFSAALQLAEAIWIIAKSLATVQYARISAQKSIEFAKDLTILMSKVSFLFSLLAATCLALIPESMLGQFLGKDFTNVKVIMLCLMPGILFFSISLIYCHYFSGLGRFFYNTIGSVISLVIIVLGSIMLLPVYGPKTAALINSAGLLGMLIYYVLILILKEKISPARLLPVRNDLKKARGIISGFIRRNG